MKVVTWILRILSAAAFIAMCYLIYSAMDVNDVWHWTAPYNFVVTVYRLLSLIFFFLAVLIMTGLTSIFFGMSEATTAVVWVYNTVILKLWYMQPYGVSGPVTDISQIFVRFGADFITIIGILQTDTFLFLYFLFAGVGVALFLQSLVRMEHKFVGGAFISIQAILVVATVFNTFFSPDLILPTYTELPTDFFLFLASNLQILALVSFAYLEVSYQMIYSASVGKPVEDREETLKKQLLALRQATRKQDSVERGDKVGTTAMSRSSGATAFSFLREAIERKVIGSQDALENLDAVADVRRLQVFVDELLANDQHARDELTAKASAPSGSFVIGSTILGSTIRFLLVIAISFLLMSPQILLGGIDLPPGISHSVERHQPEIVLFLLVPIVLLFPLIALIIGWLSKRDEDEERITKEQRAERKQRKKEIEKKKKETEKKRRERAKERKRSKKEKELDEWDKALESTYRS